MRILVTGGAGFIGSHLVDRLVADGHEVVIIDNCSTGREENLRHHLTDGQRRVTFLRGSVLNETLVAATMRDVDLCYHLAAAVGVRHIVEDPLWTIITNTRGTELVLKRAAENDVRVVFASTSEIYGQSEEVPFQEDGPRVLGPTWISRWAYSTSKALDEHLCFAHAQRGLRMSIVRYFNVFGTRLDPAGYGSVIARFITQAGAGEPLTVHSDGRQSRSFTHVSEAVDATILAGTLDAPLGEAINVGSSFEHSIIDLAKLIRRRMGSDSEIVFLPYEDAFGVEFADTRRRVPDVSKAAALLDWRATINLEDGLDSLLEERVACAS